ncbi:hypothetical protein G6F57_002187 [Rhizopus arrhizus]|uniref:Tc1-like transposase DDE domain-containing protein n=1 Tax=Rhizopus oryzae TaxID=64495 RepID=A0A9P7BMK4_RHIOR|nr:hypothetical protein G6F21_010574 [Rhizopus arrhizus]KAG1411800.1 hypothetical protein G6F58_008364 [Rhizopus delemar]KAG0801441.1 hypothetical protein G6F22_001245 [Rhizopus arrhizus]KAG0806686.1 hypothetical protein G6F20_010935 [Rhizopus arrhizus]KAG0823161.1 hypothetical protein G6F19_011003 [Rhizopus arrhizus]
MNSFIQEDGMGNMLDEEGDQFVELKMEVDEVNYPLDDVTTFDQYNDLKPPEKMQQDKKEVPEEDLSSEKKKSEQMSIRGAAAAAEIKVSSSTAYNWHKKGLKSLELDEDIEKGGARGAVKVRRPAVLNDIHKNYLTSLVGEKSSIVLDEMIKSLTKFTDLKVSKNSLHEFVTEKYEAAFNINLKRSMAWPKKGERAVVVTPKIRAKITTIIGAISPYGVVNIKAKSPKVAGPSKKRKAASSSSVVVGKDKHELFKGYYLVMDNAPIHKHTGIRSYIENRCYACVYLPPYSPELNPIEQFWSVCKSKLKREALLEEEILISRIKFTCNNVLISDLRGFCKYSVAKFSGCLEKSPI